MPLRLKDILAEKERKVRDVKSIPKREVLPLKQVKTFTAYLTKDIKIPSLMQLTMVGAKTLYAVNLEKGDKVSVTEFFDGETFWSTNWSTMKAEKSDQQMHSALGMSLPVTNNLVFSSRRGVTLIKNSLKI